MTVKVKVAFDGTDFCGSQVQPNLRTVFGEFQKALTLVVNDAAEIKGCSRLDSGVHAKCFYFSFKTEKQLDLRKFPLGLNANLPKDIRVIEASEESEDFHARYSAKGKEYTYYIKNNHIDDPFTSRYYYKFPQKLDVEAMGRAAEYFCGQHDFAAFCGNKRMKKSTVRQIYFLNIEKQGEELRIVINGNGFLHNMVRIIVGTLVEVGQGKRDPDSIPALFEGCRAETGPLMPPQGLCLMEVEY